MTLSALGRLRALPTIALALALAAALAGCSTSEPAEEAPAPAPAEEPAAPEAPAEEEAEEPEPIDKSQLVAKSTSYYLDSEQEPDVRTATYDDTGRLLSVGDATSKYEWTYDDEGRILTEKVSALSDVEGAGDTLTTNTYNADGTLAETVVEDSTPALYFDPETGETGEDPSLGELWQEAGESYRLVFSYSDDGTQETAESYTLDGDLTGSRIFYYDEDVRTLYDEVSTDPQLLGAVISPALPLKTELFDETGTQTGEVTHTYDANGNETSMIETSAEDTTEQTYTYDENGNETSSAISSSIMPEMNNSSQTTWTYDEAGRPTASVLVSDGANSWFEFFTYDSKGRLKTVTSVVPMMDAETGEELEPTIGCTVYNYLIDDEEPTTTPEQLMADARAQVETA